MTGFLRCAACEGYGFNRAGDFADRSFPRCPVCGGAGETTVKWNDPGDAAEPPAPVRDADTRPCDVAF